MARIEDIPEPTRTNLVNLLCPRFDTTPFVAGSPLSQRRVAVVSSAALIRRGETPFPIGSTEVRMLPASLPPGDILTTHPSIAHDRTGWQRDINVIYPLDRLRAMAAAGEIGSVADMHYTVLGASDPVGMADTAAQIVGQLQQERSDAVLLSPV